jgi:hypothetical protein
MSDVRHSKQTDLGTDYDLYDYLDKEYEPEMVKVMLLKNLKVNYTGHYTGNLYIFSGGGSVVDVDIRDLDSMLSKMSGACDGCSSTGKTHYFSLVEA